MGITALGFFGGEDTCSHHSSSFSHSNCFFFVLFSLATISFGCLPIIFIGEAAWSAFKNRRHWIPAGSLVVGALVLELLPFLNQSFNFPGDFFNKDQQDQAVSLLNNDDYHVDYQDQEKRIRRYSVLIFYSNWASVLCGRVSMFVLMGCLLPGVARPLSATLWRDMAAPIISSSLSLFHISYETFRISKLIHKNHGEFWHVLVCNLTMLVSLAILVLLLVSAALASVSLCKAWAHKIPTIVFAQDFSTQSVWEEVEELACQSLIVARTADPRYIMARSFLTSSIAFLITICNVILIFETLIYMPYGSVDIWFVLRCVVIAMGSIIIYWRCITAVVFYSKTLEWKLSSIREFFQIESFWNSHLLDFIDYFNTHQESGDRSLVKLMIKLCRNLRLHKLLYLLHYILMFSIYISKICWFFAQMLFSNKYPAKLLIGSAYEEFCNLSRSKSHREIEPGKVSDFDKYFRSLVAMEGENRAGIWIANRKSIQEVKEQMEKREDEGKKYEDLICLLRNYSTIDFSNQSLWRLHTGPHIIGEVERKLTVERKLNVRKSSWKMVAISIIAAIIEVSSFSDTNSMVESVIKACSQAWDIVEVVELSDGEAVELCEAANNIFQRLEKEHKWLEYSLPVSKDIERSPTAVREAMEKLFEKGKQTADQYQVRKWSAIVAGYTLSKLGVHINDQLTEVEEILKKLKEMLADVIGSCTVRAVGVIMEDCKKHAAMYDEASILRIAGVAGKVKGVTENLGWKLNCSQDEGTQCIKTSLADQVTAISFQTA